MDNAKRQLFINNSSGICFWLQVSLPNTAEGDLETFMPFILQTQERLKRTLFTVPVLSAHLSFSISTENLTWGVMETIKLCDGTTKMYRHCRQPYPSSGMPVGGNHVPYV